MIVIVQKPNNRYGFFAFTFDLTMTAMTCGAWLVRIFVREMRRRS